MFDIDQTLSVKSTCSQLGISRTSFYRYVQSGALPKPIKLGRRSLMLKSEIKEAIERMRTARL